MAFRCCFIFEPCLVVNDVLVQLCLNESAILGSFEWATGVKFSECSVPLNTVEITEAVNATAETLELGLSKATNLGWTYLS